MQDEERVDVFPSMSIFCPNGTLKMDAVVERILKEKENARIDGFSNLVVVINVSWCKNSLDLFHSLMVQGSRLDVLPVLSGITIVQQYEGSLLTSEQIEEQKRSHQLVLENGALVRNYWVISSRFYRLPRGGSVYTGRARQK